ncbi:MAG: hypothetical protein H7329_19355 [Opitutaceae bacterium]|nr:hypothetical protein [Cytophagales bacterium]
MKANTELLLPDTYYHIYNRGINGEDIFKLEKHYFLFLQKYIFHIDPIADTFAYCLLKNHFHILIRTKSEEEILEYVEKQFPGKLIESVPHFISKQFAHLFNGYTQKINLETKRTGGLFENPFRRIEVKNDKYLSQLIWYIHFNPQKHEFVKDFKEYPHSSYHSHLLQKQTRLKREEVIEWFGSLDDYQRFHLLQHTEKNLKDLVIEF